MFTAGELPDIFKDARGEMVWITKAPYGMELLGYIPGFMSNLDPRPAKEQINERYAHGGGWNKFDGFKLDAKTGSLVYPVPEEEGGDEKYEPIAISMCHDEVIMVYPHAWVCILTKATKAWEVARLD